MEVCKRRKQGSGRERKQEDTDGESTNLGGLRRVRVKGQVRLDSGGDF